MKLTASGILADASLTGLALKNASDDSTVALNETFSSTSTTYAAAVANAVTSITVEPTPRNASAEVAYLNASDVELTDADANKTGFQADLTVGDNVIKVQVTSEDVTTMQTYTVTVTREALAPALVSNTGLGVDHSVGVGNAYSGLYVQRFRTGNNASGYRLDSVVIRVQQDNRSAGETITVSIHHVDESATYRLGALAYTLSTPNLVSEGALNEFAAPANAVLLPDTWYAVSLVGTGDSAEDFVIDTVLSDEETGEADWQIEHSLRAGGVDNPGPQGPSLIISVHGSARMDAANTEATGAPEITGTAEPGQTLSAGVTGISDANGTTKAEAGDAGYAYAYQWQSVDADGSSNPVDIAGATQGTYTVISADVGKRIRVRVRFTDDADYLEGPLTSNAFPAAGTVTCDGLWCATLNVKDLGSGNRGCANSSAGNVCTNTSHLSEDEFTHAASSYSVTAVNLQSTGQLRLFVSPEIDVGIESLVLRVGSATFAFEDADEQDVRSRYWDSTGLGWSLGDAVELKLTESGVSTDAVLNGLALRNASDDSPLALDETFIPTLTTYTATVANPVTSITVEPTPRNASAEVAYLNASDVKLTDADTNTTGFQADLTEGDNVIKVQVTAEDDTTTRTYTVTVTRLPEAVWSTTMTVGETTYGGADTIRGYSSIEDYGSLADDGFTHSVSYTVREVAVSTEGVDFILNPGTSLANGSDLVLEIAGEEMNLRDATKLPSVEIHYFWLADGLPSTHGFHNNGTDGSDYQTYLPLDGMVSVCLRTSTQSCPVATIVRPNEPTDAALSGLALRNASDDIPLALNETFSPTVTTYTAVAANPLASMTVEAAPRNANAEVAYLSASGVELTDADTNKTGFQVGLAEGENVIQVKVTAADGSTALTYSVTVTREASGGDAVWSTTMTVEEHTDGQRGYSGGEFGSLETASFTIGRVNFDVFALGIESIVGALHLWLSERLSSHAAYTLEFAGETLPLADADVSSDGETFVFSPAWLATHAPSLSVANVPTTLADGNQVPVCLRSATQVCPEGTTIIPTSTDATLTGLALKNASDDSAVALNETFSSTLTTYTATVANGVTSITVEPAPGNASAEVAYLNASDVELTDADANKTGFQADLTEGDNVIQVQVTAEDDNTTLTYEVTVTREAAATANVLWSTTMTVGETTGGGRGFVATGYGGPGGSLGSRTFMIGMDSYRVGTLYVYTGGLQFWMDVGPTTLSLSDYADLTLEFAGETLPLSDATHAVPVNRIFEFDQTWVAANAPSLSATQFQTTLAVDKEGVPVCLRTATQVCPGGTTTTSTDATLTGLALADSGGNTISLGETFMPATTAYAAFVANGIETVTLTATKNDSNATVAITSDDDTTSRGEAELDLIVGPNTLTVTVTAQDGATMQPYTITVTRAAACTDVWCATLTVQSLSDGRFGCASSQSGKECSAYLTEDEFTHDSTDYEVSGLQLTANGELRLFLAPPNGLTTASQSLVLLVGSERFPFAYADTKEGRARYWTNSGLNWSSGDIVDVRLVEATASNDTTLSDLEIVDSNGDTVALSPPFADDETDYTASVEDGVLQVTVTVAASDASNKLDYLDRNGNALSDADTGATGHQVVLDAGETIVQVQVTAEDGATMTYRVSVMRMLTTGATGLVSNLGEGLSNVTSGYNVTGQSFTTGSNPGGYRLTAVALRVNSHNNFASDSDTHVTLWSIVNNGPDAMIAELTSPPLGTGTRTYTAPAGVFLDPNRSYRVQLNYGLSQNSRARVRLTDSNRETSDYGWTIGNGLRYNASSHPTSWTALDASMSMRIEGEELPTSTDATLSGLALADSNDDTISLGETFVPATTTYTASVAHGIDTVTLTATKNDSNATVAITSDDDTTSPGEAELDLTVGSNTLTVTVTAQDGATEQEYTITVTRAVPPVPVDIEPNYDSIGAGLEDLVFTLTREGATTDELEATVTIVQAESWLGNSDLSHTVTFTVGDDTATLTVGASRFSFDPDTSGNLTATVTGAGIAGASAPVTIISTADAPITVSYDMSSYTFAEDAAPADVIINVEATLDSAYPRAPSRKFRVGFSTRSDTAISPGDYGPISWSPEFLHADYGPASGGGFVARKRLENNEGAYFSVEDDDVYEGTERLGVRIEIAPGFPFGLVQIAYSDGSTCAPTSSSCVPRVEYPVIITDEEDRPVLSLAADPASIAEEDDDTTTTVAENASVLTVAAASPKTFATEQTITLTFTGSAVYGTHYNVTPVDADANATGHQVTLPAETASVQVTVTAAANDTVDGHRSIDVTGSRDGTAFGTATTIALPDNDTAQVTGVSVTSGNRRAAGDQLDGGGQRHHRLPDNDTAQVTGVTVAPGNATAVDNATGVQWKSGGQSYNTGSRQATVTSGSTTSHTITGLANGTEYTVRVSATRTDANDGPPSAEGTGTPAVPTAPGVTVSKTALTVTEQDTTGDSYTVVLDTEPTATVTVTVAGHAGTDVTPNPATLTFTTSN